MAARTNSSIISDQAKALSAGITTQRGGLTRINNALDNVVISTRMIHKRPSKLEIWSIYQSDNLTFKLRWELAYYIYSLLPLL